MHLIPMVHSIDRHLTLVSITYKPMALFRFFRSPAHLPPNKVRSQKELTVPDHTSMPVNGPNANLALLNTKQSWLSDSDL